MAKKTKIKVGNRTIDISGLSPAQAKIIRRLASRGDDARTLRVFDSYNKAPSSPTEPTPPPPAPVTQAAGEVQEAVDASLPITDQVLPEGSFGRVNEQTSAEMQGLLDFLRNRAEAESQYTGLESEAIEQLRSGLQGYTAPEVQAMREAASQEINRSLQSQLAQQARLQARSGIRGAAAAAGSQDLQIGAVQAHGNLERDLLIKNADEVQARRVAFSNMVNTTEQARAGRSATFTGMYGSAATGEEAARRGREAFNVNAGTNEALTRASTTMGTAGTILGQQGANANIDILKQHNDFTQKSLEDQSRAAAEQAAALRRSLNA